MHNVSPLCCAVRSKGLLQITYFCTDCMWVMSIRKTRSKAERETLNTPIPASALASDSIRSIAPSCNGRLKSDTNMVFLSDKMSSVLKRSVRCGRAVNIPRLASSPVKPLRPEELVHQWWRSSSYLSTRGVSVSERSLGMNWTGNHRRTESCRWYQSIGRCCTNYLLWRRLNRTAPKLIFRMF